MAFEVTEKMREYWQKNVRLTATLLAIWFVVTYVVAWFARPMWEAWAGGQGMSFLGFPLGFYIGAQGALVVYVLIIWYYARAMNKLDIEYGVQEGEE